jgi:hypothetical protein
MVLIVKGKSYKNTIRKGLSFVVLLGIFTYYYNHMSLQFQNENRKLADELAIKKALIAKKIDLKRTVSRLIYKEAEVCVDLLNQEKIKSVKIIKDRLIIVCDWDTDIEPLFIRYGVLALVKSSPENIKIAIELKFIVESRYEV